MFVFDVEQKPHVRRGVNEDVLSAKKLKKAGRDATAAAEAAMHDAVPGFNPFEFLYKRHKEAKADALKVFKHEMRQAVDEVNKVTMSTNFIKNKGFVVPRNGCLLIGVHVYLAGKKGFFQRLMTGNMANWLTTGTKLGLKALQVYVGKFAGEAFAKQISAKNVFNGLGMNENEGKISYYCSLKIPNSMSFD